MNDDAANAMDLARNVQRGDLILKKAGKYRSPSAISASDETGLRDVIESAKRYTPQQFKKAMRELSDTEKDYGEQIAKSQKQHRYHRELLQRLDTDGAVALKGTPYENHQVRWGPASPEAIHAARAAGEPTGGYRAATPEETRAHISEKSELAEAKAKENARWLRNTQARIRLLQKHFSGNGFASGGAVDENDIKNALTTVRTPKFHVGPIHSGVSGRTDHLPITVESGSYVLPADIVSAGGEGNTLAGFRVLRRTFGGEPYGVKGPYGQTKGVYGLPVSYASGGKVRAAGIMFLSPEKQVLLMRRAGENHKSEWAFPAGHIEKGETPERAARRETQEEAGYEHDGGLSPFMHTDSHGVDFVTYLAHSPRFAPKLNEEHDAAMWVDPAEAHKLPLHPGVKRALEKLSERVGKAHGGGSSGVPIVAAGGEHVLSPEQVRRVGKGDLDVGHRVLDGFVKAARKELIGTLSKLPGPRKD